ncbi:MAG: lytic transglycosylase domain-containing protein [Deltaproteobacteria bacterium]|nr:lytic transglycosylase domain-containing protein [Deltaproteobacteria bacterium]
MPTVGRQGRYGGERPGLRALLAGLPPLLAVVLPLTVGAAHLRAQSMETTPEGAFTESGILTPSEERVAPVQSACGTGADLQPLLLSLSLPSDWVRARNAYLAGLCLEGAGHLAEAARIYEQGMQLQRPLRPLFQMGAFRVRLQLREHPEALAMLMTLLRDNAQSPLRGRIRELLLAQTEGPQALAPDLVFPYLAAYEAFADSTPEDTPLIEHLLRLAQEQKREDLSRRLPRLLFRLPLDKRAGERWAHLPAALHKSKQPPLSAEDLLTRAQRLFRLREFAQMAKELEPGTLPELSGNSAQDLGRLYFRGLIQANELSHAAVQIHTRQVTRRFGFDRRQELIWGIRIQLRRNLLGPALKMLGELETLDAKDENLPEIFALVASAHQRRKNDPTQRHWLERIITEFPNSQEASDALWRMAWDFIQDKNAPKALKVLERAIANGKAFHPVDQARMLYWKGRLLVDQGQTESGKAVWAEMRAQWPFGYYAALSEQMNGGNPLSFQGSHNGVHTPQPAAPATLEALWKVEPFPEAVFLFIVGEADLALELLRPVMDKPLSPQAVVEAGQLFQALESHHLQLRLIDNHELSQLRSAEVTHSDLMWRAFPRPHWERVESEARRQEIDPYLILAVMREESRFYSPADSRAGAKGLMQIMPTTAQALAKQLKLAFEEHHLHLPDTNIPLGAYYLKRILKRFDGNPVYAVAAYNAGPTILSRWLRDRRELPMDYFIESIPYEETQNYVKRVYFSYFVYTKLYR